jgi:hypothetical protein
MEAWQINISLIPSLAVILTSANRLALGLTDEINIRLSANTDAYGEILPLKVEQLKRLSIAVFIMYLSLSLLIVNALLVGLEIIPASADKILILFSIVLFLVAVYFKVSFAYHAYFIRRRQFNHFIKKIKKDDQN